MSPQERAASRPRRPYIIFTRLDDDYSRRLSAWQAHRSLLLGAELEDDSRIRGLARSAVLTEPKTPRRSKAASGDTEGLLLWRLFTPTHRQLGAGARQFRDFDRARADALSVTKNVDNLATLRTRGPSGDRFGWIVTERAEATLLSYHWFGTRHDRNVSLEATLAALRQADVASSVDEVVEGHLDPWHRFPTLVRDGSAALSSSLRESSLRPLKPQRPLPPSRPRGSR